MKTRFIPYAWAKAAAGILVLNLCLLPLPARAQEDTDAGSRPAAHFYLGPALGIDSPTGMVGLIAEVPFIQKFSIMGGAGIGSWGWKFAGGFNFYFRQAPYGSALGAAYNLSLGLKGLQTQVPVEPSGEYETVTIDMCPASSVSLIYSHSWTLGKKGKFSLFTGYAVSLNKTPWEVVSGHTLDEIGDMAIRWVKPGGIIFGMQFMLGI